ncbi:hypothetical protein SAMN04488693_11840 [Arthrobacter subterraneus]|uniref:Uncharacterized protein n=1 Tax=Arthrobacter subterraneus TaxID=335973 RepID=A0A1G8MMD1_9MICC|nr:hypothetical protein [Arthrobacter subterraneus]SDI68490.1 hypothetical protein SAMN04488693_11840 [Arthrobacter subterraneus]
MLKKILIMLAPVIASKLLGRRQQGRANTKYSRGRNRGFRR